MMSHEMYLISAQLRATHGGCEDFGLWGLFELIMFNWEPNRVDLPYALDKIDDSERFDLLLKALIPHQKREYFKDEDENIKLNRLVSELEIYIQDNEG